MVGWLPCMCCCDSDTHAIANANANATANANANANANVNATATPANGDGKSASECSHNPQYKLQDNANVCSAALDDSKNIAPDRPTNQPTSPAHPVDRTQAKALDGRVVWVRAQRGHNKVDGSKSWDRNLRLQIVVVLLLPDVAQCLQRSGLQSNVGQ